MLTVLEAAPKRQLVCLKWLTAAIRYGKLQRIPPWPNHQSVQVPLADSQLRADILSEASSDEHSAQKAIDSSKVTL